MKATFVLLSMILLLAACGGSEEKASSDSEANEEQDVYTFIGVTGNNDNDLLSQSFFVFQEKIEKNSNGRIVLDYRGGPETIPPTDVGESLRNGAIDFATTPAAYYAQTVPEGLALSYSEIDTQTELERGAIDYLDEIHQQKLNAKLLGRGSEYKFGLYSKEKFTSIEDFKGKRLRGTPTYAPLIDALGAEMISLPAGEIFEALDKNVIDAFGWVSIGMTDLGLEDLVGYKLAPESEYYRVDSVNLVNLDKWNALPDDLKEIMIQTQREVEEEMHNVTQQYFEREAKKLAEGGVEEVVLGEDFFQIASDAGWGFINDNVENPEKLGELFRE